MEGGTLLRAIGQSNGVVHAYKGNNDWEKQDGICRNISVGRDGTIWAVTANNLIYSGSCATETTVVASNGRLQINGTYTIKSRIINQSILSTSWNGHNAIMYNAATIYPEHKWKFTHLGDGKHTIKNEGSGRDYFGTKSCYGSIANQSF